MTYAEAETFYLRDCGRGPVPAAVPGRELGLVAAGLALAAKGLAGF